jgi:hypothetical protein
MNGIVALGALQVGGCFMIIALEILRKKPLEGCHSPEIDRLQLATLKRIKSLQGF